MYKKILIAGASIGVLLVMVFGIAMVDQASSTTNDTNNQTAQEEAISKARLYESDELCAQVITPAIHTETGAELAFPSSCLAPGWEATE